MEGELTHMHKIATPPPNLENMFKMHFMSYSKIHLFEKFGNLVE